jgi:formate--tetrahydrofolate ligase
VAKGLENLKRHVGNIARFGLPSIIALNRFGSDTDAEIAAVIEGCRAIGAEAIVCEHWAHGGRGAEDLARAVVRGVEAGAARFKPLYNLDAPLADKIKTIATNIYAASDVAIPKAVANRLEEFEQMGFGDLPICIAKTPYSFSADPELRGAPEGFVLPVREVRLSAGAGFVVAICGDVMTMPGLPRRPAAERMTVDAKGRVSGLS